MATNDSKRIGAIISSEGAAAATVKPRIDAYEQQYISGNVETRKEAYMSQVNAFYDLGTAFIEYAWGKSFHFAPAFKGEGFEASIARYEHQMATKIGAKKGMRIVDVGCGVGGPARAIARFSGCNVVGINNNAYQIGRATKLNEEAHLASQISFKQTDFMKLAEVFPENTFDGGFSIEAIAHAPDKRALYSQILKVLKPGAWFITAEWGMTDKYDPSNPVHSRSKFLIEKGNGIVDLERNRDIIKHFKDAGFAEVEAVDWAETSEVPWYQPLDFNLSLQGLARSRPGHYVTHVMLSLMECLRLAPAGTLDVSRILMETGDGLLVGGKEGTFTPMLILLGRKPL